MYTVIFIRAMQLQKAEAQLAYELQAAKIQQRIRNEEIQIQVGAAQISSHLLVFFLVFCTFLCRMDSQ